MKSNIMYMENNPPMLRTEPDIIIHQPITSQPSLNSLNICGPWAYMPCGSAPLERQNGSWNTMDISSHGKPGSLSESRDTISMSTQAGSRDWSKGLFDSFKEMQKSTQKCSAFTFLCGECFSTPCKISSIAKSLGDKGYLPFIPGTGAAIRFKVRILGGIQGSIANDCLVMSCCCPCATCQMYKEMEDIGLGPTW